MKSTIEWTEHTWNPVTGCTKISPGCTHCYAADVAKRFWGDRAFSDVRFHPERLNEPLKRKKPTTYFVDSMSDLFHEAVTDEQLDQIFAVMALTPQHTYQVLTKRPQRMMEYCNDRLDIRRLLKAIDLPVPGGAYTIKLPLPNVWLGVTVEDQKRADERIPLLLETPAAVRFLSCEPLLENITLFHDFFDPSECLIDWLIVGGESGPKARPFDLDWARSLVQQCKAANTPVFVKQLGSKPKIQVHDCHKPPQNWCDFGSTGKGANPEEWPEDLRIREMPQSAIALS